LALASQTLAALAGLVVARQVQADNLVEQEPRDKVLRVARHLAMTAAAAAALDKQVFLVLPGLVALVLHQLLRGRLLLGQAAVAAVLMTVQRALTVGLAAAVLVGRQAVAWAAQELQTLVVVAAVR
jgi:hypothetical protein